MKIRHELRKIWTKSDGQILCTFENRINARSLVLAGQNSVKLWARTLQYTRNNIVNYRRIAKLIFFELYPKHQAMESHRLHKEI
jgi:hypothetical protein